ncbi:hypothetical protein STAS_18597 [Striga asiatica]|uniref:Uncharacterized protein n=1 Tax=Striga asiatica TaxID=4170 RepID=A0A5A7QAB7_STRAF|nr:hypothetical protein STAS_18597 [Striga asiatica]
MPITKGQRSMLPCLKPSVPSTSNNISSPASQVHSGDNTPASSVQLSPTINLNREYTLALQTNSYSEIRRTFDPNPNIPVSTGHADLDNVLQPSREHVQEALSQIAPGSSLSRLVTAYFEHSEQTSRLCLHLYRDVQHVRLAYSPVHNLLEHLPFDSHSSLSPSQCQLAFEAFVNFDRLENPFLPLDFDAISDLRRQLDYRLKKSRTTLNRMRRCSVGSAVCLIAVTVGIAVSAVAIGAHALVALVAGPVCPPVVFLPKKELVSLSQLDAAAKGAYVLGNDVDTIERLVARLQAAVENDRLLVRLGVERGLDGYSIQEVLKQLGRNRASLVQQLEDLEEHVFLCFAAINRARAMLLQEIRGSQEPA